MAVFTSTSVEHLHLLTAHLHHAANSEIETYFVYDSLDWSARSCYFCKFNHPSCSSSSHLDAVCDILAWGPRIHLDVNYQMYEASTKSWLISSLIRQENKCESQTATLTAQTNPLQPCFSLPPSLARLSLSTILPALWKQTELPGRTALLNAPLSLSDRELNWEDFAMCHVP